MAFSKAKILRFNDIKSCAPAPGAYNPKYDKHVPGAPLFTKEKASESPSPASSCIDVKSVHSCISIPSFRTPTIPRRKKVPLFNSAGKKAALFSPVQKTENSEALREKIVECQNKDETIKELETQIEDLKQKISYVNIEKNQLTKEKDEAIEKLKVVHENEMEEITSRITAINDENNQNVKDLLTVQEEFIKLKALLDNFKTSNVKANAKLEEKITTLHQLDKELKLRKEENLNLQNQYEESLHMQAALQHRHATEIESIKKHYQTDMEDLEYELLKIVTDTQKATIQLEKSHINTLNTIESKHEEEIEKLLYINELYAQQIKEETEAQIRQSEENCTEKIKLAEIQMEENCKELERNWQMKFEDQERKSAEILKECQSIAEFNIIQCEIEKNELKQELEENEKLIDELNDKNLKLSMENCELEKSVSNLQTDLSTIIIELNDTRAKLGTEIGTHNQNLERVLAEKHLYEITLNKTYDTVNALKNRLLHSDQDVEQLKDELEILEISKLDVETKHLQATEELQQIIKINEDLRFENIFLQDVQDKISSLEIELLGKIDDLKLKSDSEISKLNKTISEKQTTIEELNSYIQLQQKLHNKLHILVGDAKNEIERQETDYIDYKFQISRLESSLNSLNKEFLMQGKTLEKKNECIIELKEQLKEKENEIDEITNIYKKYIERNKNIEKNYDDLLMKCQKLEKTVAEQNTLIGPFRKQLMTLKKNNALSENKNEYEAKISQQNKTIEKLTQEIAKLSKSNRRSKSVATDKENICSPVRQQVFTSVLDSPGSGSPLKERNN